MGNNKYEIDTEKLLDIACGNVIDREFSETLVIKLPKQLLFFVCVLQF